MIQLNTFKSYEFDFELTFKQSFKDMKALRNVEEDSY